MGFRTYTCPRARRCGGCEWLAVPYPIQLERKQRLVSELLGPLAAKDGGTLAPIRGMAEPLAYRHKCASPFAPGKGGRLRCGFYAAGTHRIVACERCLVEHPLGRRVINSVARHAARLGIPAYHEDSGSGWLRHAVVRVGRATDDALLTLVANGGHPPRAHQLSTAVMAEISQVKGVVLNVNTRRGNAMYGRACRTLAGASTISDRLLGCSFDIGATTFYQTNPAQTEVLYQAVLDGAGLDGVGGRGLPDDVAHGGARPCATKRLPSTGTPSSTALRILDAYCGCGTIGICMASAARRLSRDVLVTGVERDAGSVVAARRNALANGVADACTFIRADATNYLKRSTARSLGEVSDAGQPPYDIIVMDPPRAGSTQDFLSAVCSLAPHRVIYVSCNVVTQARDLRILRDGGYHVASVVPVDMFPHTKHVESVVALTL